MQRNLISSIPIQHLITQVLRFKIGNIGKHSFPTAAAPPSIPLSSNLSTIQSPVAAASLYYSRHRTCSTADTGLPVVGTALYSTSFYFKTQYCTVLWCTVLHCIALYCTVLYCILIFSSQSWQNPTEGHALNAKNALKFGLFWSKYIGDHSSTRIVPMIALTWIILLC